MEKCGKIWKNARFSGRLRPDWGNTARAATAGLGSIGLHKNNSIIAVKLTYGRNMNNYFNRTISTIEGSGKTEYFFFIKLYSFTKK